MIGRHSGFFSGSNPDMAAAAARWARRGSLLSEPDLKQAMHEGWLICYPQVLVEKNNLAMRMHNQFWRQNKERFEKKYTALNTGNLEQIKLLWDLECAQTGDEILAQHPEERLTVEPFPPETRFIYLKPQEMVLAATYEILGIFYCGVGYLTTKSCPAREGGDTVGSSNEHRLNTMGRIVLELKNWLSVPVIFPVGRPIVTVTVELVTTPIPPDSIPDPEQLMREWTPESMLRAYLA